MKRSTPMVVTIPVALAAVALMAGCNAAPADNAKGKPVAAKAAVPEYVGAPTTLPADATVVNPRTPSAEGQPAGATPTGSASSGSSGSAPSGGSSAAGSARSDDNGEAGGTTLSRDATPGAAGGATSTTTKPPGPVLADGSDDVKLAGCESIGGVAFAKVTVKNSGSKAANYLIQGTATTKQAAPAKAATAAKKTAAPVKKGQPATTATTAKAVTAQLVGGTVVKPGESATINLAGGGAPASVTCRIDKVSRF